MLVAISIGRRAVKTLHHPSPPVLNGRCRITQLDMHLKTGGWLGFFKQLANKEHKCNTDVDYSLENMILYCTRTPTNKIIITFQEQQHSMFRFMSNACAYQLQPV